MSYGESGGSRAHILGIICSKLLVSTLWLLLDLPAATSEEESFLMS